MKTFLPISLCAVLLPAAAADTSITIYNENLAVVRESVPIKMEAGEASLIFDRATAQVRPDSVVLRDPAAEAAFSILEQSYRNDPVSRALLLYRFEGETIDFRHTYPDGRVEIIAGKIIRSGYVPGGQNQDPIIEVDGKMRFQLPGEPLFPALGDDSILRPTLGWQIHSEEALDFDAQLSYLSGGMNWKADYNVVAPEEGETVTITGWITVGNTSGTFFEDAQVKLIAGDVNIIREPQAMRRGAEPEVAMAMMADDAGAEQKAFDGFHLYTLRRPLSIRDRETKQVEFLRAPQVEAQRTYVYQPVNMRFHGGQPRVDPAPGMRFSTDVGIYWEFKNSEENGLGVPMPAGRMRFYREDSTDSNLEFVGENNIGHTPRNEEISLFTGNAFDLVGERVIKDYQHNERQRTMRETIEITLKNRSEKPVEIVVRENVWRWMNWEIREANFEFDKTDAQTIEFTIGLEADEEKELTFEVHYSY